MTVLHHASDEAPFTLTASTPALPADRVRADAVHGTLPTFGDVRWSLRLIDYSEVTPPMNVDWNTFPARHREQFRICCWLLINTRLDPAIANRHGVKLTPDPAPSTIYQTFTMWRMFASWLDEKRPLLRSLSHLTEQDFDAYAAHVRERVKRSDSRVPHLTSLSRLHAHSWMLPEESRPPMPPWITDRTLRRYVGPSENRGENATVPIRKATLQPLIAWAVRLVNDFDPSTYQTAEDMTVKEMQALSGACIVLIAYLTGMRPKEVCSLRIDCLREVEGDDGSVRHEVHGVAFKNERDEDGRHVSEGRERPDPWLTIEQGARAIRVQQHLARVLGSTMLIAPSQQSDPDRRIAGLTPAHTNRRIRIFIDYINSTAQPAQTTLPPIPADTAGVIKLSRFRRTLAWFIANEPGGEVALGVQYGHLRIVTGQGYAGRSEAGLEDLIDMDEILALVGLLDGLSEQRSEGAVFTGPAGMRLGAAVEAFDNQFKGVKMTDKELSRQVRSEVGLHVFDNPKAISLCVWRPETAACRVATDEDSEQTPVMSRCRLDCANHARTPEHLSQVRHECQSLLSEAAMSPEPVALRLLTRAQRLATDVDDEEQALAARSAVLAIESA